jgi:hypothetical protein
MAKKTNLARTVSIIIFAVLCGTAGFSQTTYYVDPSFTGGGNNGSASNPWTSLSSGWSAINSALAGNNVTVYFSASQSQSSQISLGSRTDTSTHVLTLNGTEMVNTNDGVNNTVTKWVPGVALTPCVGYRCAANGAWIGHQYTVTASGSALASSNNVNNCQGYYDIRGIKFVSAGQLAVLTYTHDLTVEYNDFSDSSGSIGPGIYIGPGQHGPCNSSTSNVGGPDNVTFQYNYTHKTYGECLYIGASTSDPPGYGSSEYTSNAMTCTSNCNTGAHYRILYNTQEDCAYYGGQGDGTDIKDGHGDLWFIGNTNRPSVDSPAGQGGAMGIVAESAAIIDGNYFEDVGKDLCNGIRIADSWYNFAGRQDHLIVRNNIVNGFTSGACNNYGIYLTAPDLSGSLAHWTTPIGVYNNTVYSTKNSCISISTSSLDSGAVANAENNICDATSGGISGASLHDYNNYYNAGVSCPVSGETHSTCVNPQFVSTSAPYSATNFALQSGSPLASSGADLSSFFTDDYINAVRTTPWDIGAWAQESSANAPVAPTGLLAVVN